MTTVLEHAGGFENSFMDIAKEMSKDERFDVTFVTMDESFTKKLGYLLSVYFRENLNQNPVHRETSESILKRLDGVPYKKCHSLKELKKTLSKADIIYAKNEIIEAAILKYFVGYKNINKVALLCGTTLFYPNAKSLNFKMHNYLYTGKIYQSLTKNVHQFQVKNSSDQQIVHKLHKDKQARIVFNSFDLQKFKQAVSADTSTILSEPAKINFTWIGRLEEQKGLDYLSSIIERVHKSVNPGTIAWNIVGDGTQKKLVLDLTQEYANVHYYGQIENARIPPLLAQSDLLISTSRAESFGNTIIEANAAGLQAYSFNIPGPNDIIENGYNGRLFSDVSSYALGIIDYIESYSKKDSSASYDNYIEKNFNKKAILAMRSKYLLDTLS